MSEGEPPSQKLHIELHRTYIIALQEKRNTFGQSLMRPQASANNTPHPKTS